MMVGRLDKRDEQDYFNDFLSYFGNPVRESPWTYRSELIYEYRRAGEGERRDNCQLIHRCTLYIVRIRIINLSTPT
jgi:hypothetical protein